jgi:ABC-type transport system substrate-binding protein
MGQAERVFFTIFLLLFLGSFLLLLRRFYRESTQLVPAPGGTYVEGSVGSIRNLTPWFAMQNDINRDVTSLVFCGLQRYNPFTQRLEDDAATVTVHGAGRRYVAKLKGNILWHDAVPDRPSTVSADDVLFTYRTIQQQGFMNPILQKNFRGVTVEKIDDRTVEFRLDKPYAFFRSNLTLGLIPSHQFEGVPSDRVQDALDFAFAPVGCGPYRFLSLTETELSTEVTLERFDGYQGATPNIERIVLRAFPDYRSLLSDIRSLDGIRNVPKRPDGTALIPKRFRIIPYILPQYVALFFNMDNPVLADENLRLGLQLATNKRDVASSVGESLIVDTPLLELRENDWEYSFDQDAARGALFESNWHLPEKLRLQHLLENRERNVRGVLQLPDTVALLQTGASLTVTGSILHPLLKEILQSSAIAEERPPVLLNGLPVSWKRELGPGIFMGILPADGSSGSLVVGENRVQLSKLSGDVIDTFVLTRADSQWEFRALRREQQLLEQFLLSKRPEDQGGVEESDRVSIENLFVESGVLRRRRLGDPPSVRRNERGDILKLTLLTSSSPATYPIVAEEIRKQWRPLGIELEVVVHSDRSEFERRVIERDYDLLLFGQPLLDNLDSYPFWHSSQAQAAAGEGRDLRLDANNLSQYRSFEADTLLQKIRENQNASLRRTYLEELEAIFRRDVPAIVLYSPTYLFGVRESILGIDLGFPSLHSDRFLGIHRWFIKQKRVFKPGVSWWSFFRWLPNVVRMEGARL